MKKVHVHQLLRKVILASQYKVKRPGRPVTGLQPCPPLPQAAVPGSGPLQLAFPVTGHHQLGSPGTSHSGGDHLRAGLGRGASSTPQAEPCLVLRDSVGRYMAGTHGRTAEGEVRVLGGGRGSLPLQSSRVMGNPVPRPPTPTVPSLSPVSWALAETCFQALGIWFYQPPVKYWLLHAIGQPQFKSERKGAEMDSG